ncbi:uncharacterized protein LOC120835962 isoform X1 [Ixodes scapularis]|uniref:uncharacterized protein LOC120835962 isoform X1 n=1 Tax=Ixodes scapularis TaxID=6945 RepID=UPI001161989A|nr:uncharacterized protein LOC120835962 isoform X1 [Ixodes scapularis]
MDVIEVRREPCRGTPKFRRLQAAAAAPSAAQRKRTSGCGSDRSLSSPPVKQLRFDNCCSDAFVREIEEAPKEPTFGKDSKQKHGRNGGGGGSGNNNGNNNNNTDELHHQDSLDRPGKLVLGAAREEDGGPPLPVDAMDVASPGSDIDDPAFNAFNYWKTPFPDVSIDITME